MESVSENKMTAAEFDARILAVNERIQGETETLHEQNRVLRDILTRKQQFAVRLEETYAELIAERDTIDAELRRLLSPEEQKMMANTSP